MRRFVLAFAAVLALVGAREAAAAGGSWQRVEGPILSVENDYVPKASEMMVVAKAPHLRGVVGVSGKVECYTRTMTSSYPFSARGNQVVMKYLPTGIGRAGCLVTVKGTRSADVYLWKR
jgi:hypothetical protein